MATWLTEDEALAMLERVLFCDVPEEHEDDYVRLVERSLGIAEGRLAAMIRYPEEHGLGGDPSPQALLAAARAS